MMKYVLCLVFLVLLTACQTKQGATHQGNVAANKRAAVINQKNKNKEHDGAPSGPLPSFFQKIFPMHAPLSRYGNPGAYKVKGHTYEVMTSSRGYHARGLASWYGTKFHKKRTSSGEGYNMYALTAAHKTLPIPTYVRVKNLSNGREAIVKVNDRGPFHTGRIIDLSYAAAAKLGITSTGTAPVEIEALTSTAPGKAAKPARYYLQTGAFNSMQLAQAQRRKLAKLSRSRVFVERYQKRYIVRVGPLADRRTVERLKAILKRNGVTGTFSQLM
jgi:rare lipoprotein A